MAETITPENSFEELKKNLLTSIASHFPVDSGRKQKLVLNKIWVDDTLRSDDIQSQADAKDRERTWGVPIRADISLIDKTSGKTLDNKTMTLVKLPKLTNRYGYIVDGNELQVDHLFRLKSGVYARVQDNGDLEAEFNLAKSPIGRGFSIGLDRQRKTFNILIGSSSTKAKIPLYPILHASGISDEELEKSWGKDIFAANKSANDKKYAATLSKFWEKTSRGDGQRPQDVDGLVSHVRKFFDQTRLNPDTTAVTLGHRFDQVNGQVMHYAANKLLGVSRGTQKPDDRDSLAFKEIVSAEDLLPERVERSGRHFHARLRMNVDKAQTVLDVVSPDLFNKPIQEFFRKGGSIAERSEQTNPLLMLSGNKKTTLMSDQFGGIKSRHSVNDEMRVINPSHFGFLDPMHTPESEKTGITLNLSMAARKEGRDLATPAYNLKTGRIEYVKAPRFHNEVMAVLPDQVKWVGGKPKPIAERVKVKLPGGDIDIRSFSEASHVMPTAKGLFDVASNLIPFLPTDQGNRVSMADKQMEQAISLRKPEAPLVQSRADDRDPEQTFERHIGAFTSHRAPVSGTVSAVKPDSIIISDGKTKHEVHLYNHFPLNDAKGMMHSTPVVSVGDKVQKGQHIADTNFTRGGVLSLGTNLRVGYVPYKGYNFEDGIVISESAAKKLTSDHLYKKKLELSPESGDEISKDKYRAFSAVRSANISTEHWDALDNDGVIKPGTKVVPGQLLIAALGINPGSKRGYLAPLNKRAFNPYKDKSLTWDEDHVGTVVKVIKDPAGKAHKIYVRTDEPMEVGDKLSGRHGNKGIVTQILPDHEMPFTVDEKGEKRHLEVLLNPSGVPTRINIGQILETAAGKIAEKTGKPYIVNNFAGPNHDYRQQVENDLKAHHLEDEEAVYDPKNPDRALGKALVGNQYLLKLRHQVEKKLVARGGGLDVNNKQLPVDLDMQPTKGGEHGGQGFGQLEVYSLLGHNARHNLREMATYKSDEQGPDFWTLIQQGYEPPSPRVPFAYEKFISLLKGAGINVVREGTNVRLQPLTDKEILKLSGGPKGEIIHGHLTVRSKDLKEEKGGLFDPSVTGGLTGNNWSHLRLAAPMPNPIFVGSGNVVGPIPALLGLQMKEFEDLMSGKRHLNGKYGGEAVHEALQKIDVKSELEKVKTTLPGLHGSELDRANKKARFLMALDELGMKPHEAYMLNYVPIIPPKFRPLSHTPRGDVTVAPINTLYKNLAIRNDSLKEFNTELPEEERQKLVAGVWDSLKALQSVGTYTGGYDEQNPNRKLTGILDTIAGDQPKEGYFQSKLIKRRQNLSLRSTIVPEPKLGIDQVGLPRNAAMEIYKPFVVAKMSNWGIATIDAVKEVKNGTPLAFRALEEVVKDRPFPLKRDPALHKFSVMAFLPVLHNGKAIQIHPLVTGGFNADFDGDTMAGTVPISREAVEEAKKMLPSRNLFSPTTGKVMYVPSQESLLGLHILSGWEKGSTIQTFKTPLDAEKAWKDGKIAPQTVIKVTALSPKETTLGRILIHSRLPRTFSMTQDILYNPSFSVTKKALNEISTRLAKNHSSDFAESIDRLKDLGNEHAYQAAFSFGLKDLRPLPERDAILKDAHAAADKARKTHSGDELEEKLVGIYQDATKKLDAAAEEAWRKNPNGNRLSSMVFSGARGKKEQLRQMIAAPMLMQDATNRTIPIPVTKSYAEGLDIGDYWLAQHGARKGTLQRALGTSEPGFLSKRLVNTTIDTLISSQDCKTNQGVVMPIDHDDVHDRFTAAPYRLKDGTLLKAGTLLTPEVLSRLKNSKHEKVLVRSPLKCQHGSGICAKCFGLNENGKLHDVGVNIGVLAGQALGEPATQMAMDAFHSGGVAAGRGASSVDRFTRLGQLLDMPKQLKGEATLAEVSGSISKITKAPQGGVYVRVGDAEHYVPEKLVKHDLKVGDVVKRGKPLSEGPVNPHHLLRLTDVHDVQNYLTSELYDRLYKGEGVRRRNVEMAVRAMTNLTKVYDPGDSHYLHGDTVPLSVVEEYNRNLPKGARPIAHAPLLKGLNDITLTKSTDWMARLNFQELPKTILQGAAMAWKSDLHGPHPVPGLAHGAEFGRPPAGKPGHNY